MALPKLTYPTYTITVPSLKKEHKFRPFLVKEEKLLLMAKESATPSDVLSAVKQVVNNCCLDKLDINKLAIFDLEYIFLKLRANSVDNICKVSFKDREDDKVYDFDIDLNSVEVIFPEKLNKVIKLNEKMGIVMKYPSASLYDDKDFLSLNDNYLFELIVRCIDKIYDGDQVYDAKTHSLSEMKDFLDTLDGKSFIAIQQFLLDIPKLKHVMNYTNSKGTKQEIVLSSLNDFFTLR